MDKFEWGNIYAFGWFAIVFLALFFIFLGEKKRIRIIKKFIDLNLISKMVKGLTSKRRLIKNILILSGLIFSVIALMEPKYDYTWKIVKKKGVDIIVALDISKSMLASDIKPSRFERSKLEIKNLINNLEGDRIGLIIFTSKALTQCPLTIDYYTFKMFLDQVQIGALPRGGTSLPSAVLEAINSFDKKYKKERILIVVTDGESHDENLDRAIEEAKKNEVKIYSVGLGSKEGVPILLSSKKGEKEYLKDKEGNIVLTKLNDDSLKKLAFHTGGAYIPGGAQGFSLEKLYKETIAPIEGREIESKRKKTYEHRFYIPLAIAVFLLLLEIFISDE